MQPEAWFWKTRQLGAMLQFPAPSAEIWRASSTRRVSRLRLSRSARLFMTVPLGRTPSVELLRTGALNYTHRSWLVNQRSRDPVPAATRDAGQAAGIPLRERAR